MKSSDKSVLLKPHPRSVAFDHTTANSHQQSLDAPPFKRCRNRVGEYCGERFAMRGIHVVMVSNNGTMSSSFDR